MWIWGRGLIKQKEVWKDIIGYKGLYVVSNCGQVKSFHIYKGTNERILSPNKMKCGHFQVNLCKNKMKKNHLIHRLVMRAFVGPCPNGLECCHNDGDPSNNHIANLRYDTRQSNRNDMKMHGVSCARKSSTKGSHNPFSKLVEDDIIKINRLLDRGILTQKEIAKIFNVSRSTITLIHNKKTWRHVGE